MTGYYRRRVPRGQSLAIGSWFGAAFFFALIIAGIVFLTSIIGALVSDDKAINAAKDAGYTNIEIVDKTIWFVALRGCGESDEVRFTVRGTNAIGEEREFYVCAGVFKGGTVRSK